jgi:hypothetical protein
MPTICDKIMDVCPVLAEKTQKESFLGGFNVTEICILSFRGVGTSAYFMRE